MFSDESEAIESDLAASSDLKKLQGPRIKVIGVGDAGGEAVNRLIEDGTEGVEFLVANTNLQSLKDSRAPVKIQLGEEIARGLGANGSIEIGKRAAIEKADKLIDALDGADVVFVAAGLGGGTGTGAAPIIGRIATELGALTIAVVTKPFGFEGQVPARLADQGLEELQGCVASVITIPNEQLLKSFDRAIPSSDAFGLADGILRQAVRAVSDIIFLPGLINVDVADIRAVLEGRGVAQMGTGQASGESRAIEAMQRAMSSPLFDKISIRGANSVLVNITGSSDLTLFELSEAMELVYAVADSEANIIFGAVMDERLSGQVRITVIATHFAPAGSESGDNTTAIPLRDLSTEFDALVARMQTPKARKALDSAFHASPATLGRAAVRSARKRS